MKLIETMYEKMYGSMIIPLSYYLRFDFRYWHYNKYKANLTKTKEEISRYQLARLKKLVRYAYENVPYYTRLFDENKINPRIESLDDFKKIPVLQKKTVIENIDQLKSKEKLKLIETTSGGSTGNRVVVYKDKRYNEISRAVWMRDLFSAGISPGEKSAWIWGSPIENKPLKEKMIAKIPWLLNRRIIFNASHYTNNELEDWLVNEFNSFKPDYIYGYANSIFQVAKFIKENNLKVHPVKKIITTSERLENREFIESVFGCKVINQYGSREILEIAIEDNNQVMHSADDFVLVETSQEGNVILTPLESYGMPLLRYAIGDAGLKKNGSKTRKYPFSNFNLTICRTSELFINSKNERISLLPFSTKISSMKLGVGEFQLVQKSKDKIHLNLVKDEITEAHDVDMLKEAIRKYTGCRQIKVNYMKKFPLEKSGKKLAFKCEIDKQQERQERQEKQEKQAKQEKHERQERHKTSQRKSKAGKVK